MNYEKKYIFGTEVSLTFIKKIFPESQRPIEIPALRDRKEDIPKLTDYFLKRFSIFGKKSITEIDNEAMEALLHYTWPGNVRELENAIEYAFARSKKNVISVHVLPPSIRKQKFSHQPDLPQKVFSVSTSKQSDNELINVLEKNQWNRSKAAQKLGIGRTTLWRKLKALGLE